MSCPRGGSESPKARTDSARLGPLAYLAMGLVHLYRWIISPVIHAVVPGGGCRFQPTCSVYALESLARFGIWKGGWLALRRISRCHPWNEGGHDPVPPRESSTAPSILKNP